MELNWSDIDLKNADNMKSDCDINWKSTSTTSLLFISPMCVLHSDIYCTTLHYILHMCVFRAALPFLYWCVLFPFLSFGKYFICLFFFLFSRIYLFIFLLFVFKYANCWHWPCQAQDDVDDEFHLMVSMTHNIHYE